MSYIIDRRLNGKNKSLVNRQRFLDRYKAQVKEAVSEALNKRSITDIDNGENISLPPKNINEPMITNGTGGQRHRVFPGNKEFATGDEIDKPPQGGQSGGGAGKPSNQGEGEDDFSFYITKEEFLNYIFDDLELPNFVKKNLSHSKEYKKVRGGYLTEGTPNNLSIIRSMQNAHARRIGMSAGKRKKLKELTAALEACLAQEPENKQKIAQLKKDIKDVERRLKLVPFLDDMDLRYRNQVKISTPSSKAVMFCIMDVSGSMTQDIKDMAKRFYLLLYLFLERNYEETEIVFIRHHINASEVSEHDFFYSRETGGTIVSSALQLTRDIINERYASSEWNIYAAQASDGDNWVDDSPNCYQILKEDILPHVQYFSYVEITDKDHQALWRSYEKLLSEHPQLFSMAQIKSVGDIFQVFRELFMKDKAKVAE
ncbi:MAG: YeaH/YhbH family protein [Cellvibrionales bacterium]|nr:YeaH/YhbH family protein [Cellvibrionales bacterium]